MKELEETKVEETKVLEESNELEERKGFEEMKESEEMKEPRERQESELERPLLLMTEPLVQRLTHQSALRI